MPHDTGRTQIGPFAIVPLWLLERCKDARAIQVYAWIAAAHADRDGRAFPKWKSMADALACSEPSIQRAVNVLRDIGALKTTRRRRPDGSVAGLDYLIIQAKPQPITGDQLRDQPITGDRKDTRDSGSTAAEPQQPITGDQTNRSQVIGHIDRTNHTHLTKERTLLLTEPTADARNPIAVIFDAHDEGFRKITISAQAPNGQKPTHTGKDRGIVKHLLKTHAADRLVELLGVFFASEDPFIERSGYTLGVFASQIDKLIVDDKRSNQRELRRAPVVDDPAQAAARAERGRQFDAALDAAIGKMTGHELVRASELARSALKKEFPALPDVMLDQSVAARVRRELTEHVRTGLVADVDRGLGTFRECIARGSL